MLDLTSLVLDLPTSDFILEFARGVNDRGQIIASRGGHVYLLTPTAVPVPAAAWLFGSGIFGLVGAKKFGRKKA